MSIELTVPALTELKPKITVIGVGGAGGNAVNNMINANLQGVDFVAANTDAQALASSSAGHKIQLGAKTTQGLGAGSRPDVGRAAAEENEEALEAALDGSHMVFITAGMGGGTGTGGAPVVARLAKERGILTVGVVTKPFQFEGNRRMQVAEEGIKELQKHVDTLIIIPNQNLFRIANEKTTFADAFAMADEVLHSGVRGITDLMVMGGLINLDFADVNTVMNGMGNAMMGTGESEGENRAIEAAEAAVSNPLLDEVSMKGARGVIINITGGMDLTLFEVDEAANHIRAQVDPEANIIVGSAFMEELNGRMRVSVVATGLGEETAKIPYNEEQRSMSSLSIVESARNSDEAETVEEFESADVVAMPMHEHEIVDEPAESMVETLEDVQERAEFDGDADDEELDLLDRAAIDDDAFIPDAPMDPGDLVELSGQPDAFAEAAIVNANTSEAEIEQKKETPKSSRPSARPGISLFERLVGGGRQNREESANDGDESQQNAEAGVLGRVMPEDRPAPADNDDNDQLEIPSFLRRRSS